MTKIFARTLLVPLLFVYSQLPAENGDSLASFLESPIDLAEFKKTKGGANSGHADAPASAYRPEQKGFYYRYMLFNTPQSISEARRFSEFEIVVYKDGSEIGDYFDTNESLISIKSAFADPDLYDLNFVGKPVSEVSSALGDAYWERESVMVYHSKNDMLLLSISEEQVKWFRYIKLNEEINSIEEIPEEFLSF